SCPRRSRIGGMKIPRDVSAARLADWLCRKWKYTKVHQVGSHIIWKPLILLTTGIAIPDHHPLRLGTFSSILTGDFRPAMFALRNHANSFTSRDPYPGRSRLPRPYSSKHELGKSC